MNELDPEYMHAKQVGCVFIWARRSRGSQSGNMGRERGMRRGGAPTFVFHVDASDGASVVFVYYRGREYRSMKSIAGSLLRATHFIVVSIILAH